MKNRTRWLIGLQLGLGLLFVGLGHYFTAGLRPAYPLDGFFFYAVAAICFIFAWRTSRREKNAVWAALLDMWRGASLEIRARLSDGWRALRQALPYISTRAVVIAAVVLNIGAALSALLLPSLTWLWGVAWGATIIALLAYLWPRSTVRRATASTAPRATRTYAEPAIESGARVNPIGLASSIGLLLLGQLLLVLASQAPSGASPIAQAFDDAFQLRLPGDGSLIWPGVIALIVGAIMFAVVTRRSALSDYPPLAIVETAASRQRGWWLLVVAIAGIALWLFAINAVADSSAGSIEAWPWLLALLLIAACWWQIDRIRGVHFGAAP